MLKVATSNSLEGPLKLLLPAGGKSVDFPFSILGLGDVAVPGFLAALILRFDAFGRNRKPEEVAEGGEKLDKNYFVPVLVSYAFGLLLAAVANSVTNAGQPALLYIVPCMLGTSVAVGSLRGELRNRLFEYEDPTRKPEDAPPTLEEQ